MSRSAAPAPPSPWGRKEADLSAPEPGAHSTSQHSAVRRWPAVSRLHDLWDRIPGSWKYVVGLFVGTKMAVTVSALLGLYVFEPTYRTLPPDYQQFFDGQRAGAPPP